MGQLLSFIRRLFVPDAVTERPISAIPACSQPDAAEIDDAVVYRFEDRADDDDDDDENPDSRIFPVRAPETVIQSFEQLLLQTKVRVGLVAKKRKDGSFKRQRKMTIGELRTIGFHAIKHFEIACDMISMSRFRSALRELEMISENAFELAYEVALNKSHCWEKLKCYNNALDQAIRCILIDGQRSSGYFKTGRLLHHKKRFLEAEHCFKQALMYSSPGDMLTVYAIRKAMKVNMRSAITQSGYEFDVTELACHLYRRLHEAAPELQSGEAFRQKHIWSCSYVTRPAIVMDEEKRRMRRD